MPSTSSTISGTPLTLRTKGGRFVLLYLSTWFAFSTIFGASVRITELPRLVFPCLIWGLFGLCVLAYRLSSDARALLDRVPLTVPVAFHAVVRTGYGIGIVNAGARGALPSSFADFAGPGDIAVGVLAVLALFFAARPSQGSRFALLVWNAFGLLDILIVFVLAQRVVIFGAGPSAFAAMAHFPFAWLPTLVVPLVFATHLWLFARLRRIG
jgi:hypothetical protein